ILGIKKGPKVGNGLSSRINTMYYDAGSRCRAAAAAAAAAAAGARQVILIQYVQFLPKRKPNSRVHVD
ncbi:hypothetical protein Dimus_010144, partial [Dionaea muscipula]